MRASSRTSSPTSPPADGGDIELRRVTSPTRKLPFLPWQAMEPPGARKAIRLAARKRQLGYVSVVDFGAPCMHCKTPGVQTVIYDDVGNVFHEDYSDGFDDATSNENSLRSAASLIAPFLGAFPSPHPVTVRRRHGLVGSGSVNLNAATYVDYYQLPIPPGRRIEDPLFAGNREAHHLSRLTIPSCKKYVLHIAYDPFTPNVWHTVLDVILPPGTAQVTLVMAPYSHDGPTGGHIDTPLGLLRALIRGFLRFTQHVQLTIVGVENMHPSSLGFVGRTDRLAHPEETVATVRSMIERLAEEPVHSREPYNGLRPSVITPPLGLSERQAGVKRISLPTFEEWEASLPEAERAILAHPPEYEPF